MEDPPNRGQRLIRVRWAACERKMAVHSAKCLLLCGAVVPGRLVGRQRAGGVFHGLLRPCNLIPYMVVPRPIAPPKHAKVLGVQVLTYATAHSAVLACLEGANGCETTLREPGDVSAARGSCTPRGYMCAGLCPTPLPGAADQRRVMHG